MRNLAGLDGMTSFRIYSGAHLRACSLDSQRKIICLLEPLTRPSKLHTTEELRWAMCLNGMLCFVAWGKSEREECCGRWHYHYQPSISSSCSVVCYDEQSLRGLMLSLLIKPKGKNQLK